MRSGEVKSTSNLITIKVTSAGFEAGKTAKININGKDTVMTKNENNHLRGLHIVIINSNTGQVIKANVFDTYWSSEKLELFIKKNFEHNNIKGHIIAAACSDDCV